MKLIQPDNYFLKYNYYATEDGKIYSEVSNKFMSQALDKDGYPRVSIMTEDGKRKLAPVHRLILLAFEPRLDSETLQVNHIDSNRTNNNLENLEWVTPMENVIHSINFGNRKSKGENNLFAEHSEREILEIIDLIYFTNLPFSEIANSYNSSIGMIEQISGSKTWKHLSRPKGGKLYRRINSEEKILSIIDLLVDGEYSGKKIAEISNVSAKVVYDIKNKKTWKHLTQDIVF